MKKIMSFLMISFIIAINIHVHAVSDYDGEAWQPTDELQTETETGKSVQYNFIEQKSNVTVDKTFTLAKACTQMQFRMVCMANWTAGNKELTSPNGGTCRLASDASDLDGTSPVFEVVE